MGEALKDRELMEKVAKVLEPAFEALTARVIMILHVAANAPARASVTADPRVAELEAENARLRDYLARAARDYRGIATVCQKHGFQKSFKEASETADFLDDVLAARAPVPAAAHPSERVG